MIEISLQQAVFFTENPAVIFCRCSENDLEQGENPNRPENTLVLPLRIASYYRQDLGNDLWQWAEKTEANHVARVPMRADGEQYAGRFDMAQILQLYVADLCFADETIPGHVVNYCSARLQFVEIAGIARAGFLQGAQSRDSLRLAAANNKNAMVERFLTGINWQQRALSARGAQLNYYYYRSECAGANIAYLLTEGESVNSSAFIGTGGDTAAPGASIGAIWLDRDAAQLTTFQVRTAKRAADDKYTTVVNIVDDPVSEYKYLFSFRNSYGVYENVLLFGSADAAHNYNASETNYNHYEQGVGAYTPTNSRRQTAQTLTVYTGEIVAHFKTAVAAYNAEIANQRFYLIADFLASSNVYMQRAGVWVPCTVAADFSRLQLDEKPQQIAVTVTFANDANADFGLPGVDY